MCDLPKRFVYVLRSERGDKSYVGLTTDVRARLAAHNAGQNPSTAHGRPWTSAVVIEFDDERSAAQFERYLKSGSGRAFGKRHFR